MSVSRRDSLTIATPYRETCDGSVMMPSARFCPADVSAATGDVTFSTPQNIDTGASVQFGALNIATKLIVNSNGLPTKSNNVTLAGQGNAIIVAQGAATAQTGAVASVAAYTTTAAGGSFEIDGEEYVGRMSIRHELSNDDASVASVRANPTPESRCRSG